MRLAERLRMAIGGLEWSLAQCHQAMRYAHEMFCHYRQATFRKQEVNIGHTAMLAVFDRDHGATRCAIFNRFQRIFEAETGQRQCIGCKLHCRLMRIGTRRPSKSNRLSGLLRRSGTHRIDKGEGRFGELTHDVRRVKAAFLAHQALLLLAHLRKPALHTRAARNHQTNRFSPGILRNG